MEIKVGLVSFLAIVIFIVGITLGKSCSVSVSTTKVLMRFPSSGGLQPSSPVLVNGVKRGSVLSVINNEGSVLVTTELDDINDIKKDAVARIAILEITGGKKIEIYPGISSEKFNRTNVMHGETSADLSDLVSMLGDVSIDAKHLIKKLDTIANETSRLLGDKVVMDRLINTLKTTDEIATSINNLVNANKNDLQQTLLNLKTITSDLKIAIKKNEPRIDELMSKIDSTINITKGAIGNANSTITDASALIKDLRDISSEIKSAQGVAGKLLYDKELGIRLDSTLTNLGSFLKTISMYGINVNTRLGTRP
jgi:phospholipid/cholesterol/gamma-HCH transport system substrate-binding protein